MEQQIQVVLKGSITEFEEKLDKYEYGGRRI